MRPWPLARCAGFFERHPSNRALCALLPLAVLAAIAAQIGVQASMRRARHPLSLFEANLVADPTEQRGHYRLLIERGTFDWFVRTELVDLLWALSLATALVAVTIAVGRAHPRGSRWRRLALVSVPLVLLAPALDLLENAFSLAMLANPEEFPGYLAPAHALASRAKLLALGVALPYFGLHMLALGLRWAPVLARRFPGARARKGGGRSVAPESGPGGASP